ncbi:hypothetical protein [Phenylobacterium sp.]|uniref:hypothetical protein n=1 Tax=Phenylobacterium sp. TaxID=1871053 RepID=UPI002734B9DB|nr:hypothetical protein [Phenylobacterium sp.]MDP3660004.1 hypothetical protein [Phenylobacterium sp.]
MTDAQRLTVVRTAHTVIYLVMASAAFTLLYAGVSGKHGRWLWAAVMLMGVEIVVFVSSGMRCPLTAIAERNGATRTGVSDTLLPERLTRHTLVFFGPLIALAFALLAARLFWFGWR